MYTGVKCEKQVKIACVSYKPVLSDIFVHSSERVEDIDNMDKKLKYLLNNFGFEDKLGEPMEGKVWNAISKIREYRYGLFSSEFIKVIPVECNNNSDIKCDEELSSCNVIAFESGYLKSMMAWMSERLINGLVLARKYKILDTEKIIEEVAREDVLCLDRYLITDDCRDKILADQRTSRTLGYHDNHLSLLAEQAKLNRQDCSVVYQKCRDRYIETTTFQVELNTNVAIISMVLGLISCIIAMIALILEPEKIHIIILPLLIIFFSISLVMVCKICKTICFCKNKHLHD